MHLVTLTKTEILMVPMDEFNRLSSYYQGQMTESALLNKAGRLAADQHLILRENGLGKFTHRKQILTQVNDCYVLMVGMFGE